MGAVKAAASANSTDYAPIQHTVAYHQDILRSMDLQTTLTEALRMDYNISFKGSICTSEQRIESRNYLIDAQRALINVLITFVKGNAKNQAVVIKFLPILRKHLGPLKLPDNYPDDFIDVHKAQLVESPGMNTEEVIIECLRNNFALCQTSIPEDMYYDVGLLWDVEKV